MGKVAAVVQTIEPAQKICDDFINEAALALCVSSSRRVTDARRQKSHTYLSGLAKL